MEINQDIKIDIWLNALKNAIKFDGKCNMGSVMGHIMSNFPEMRKQSKEIKPIIINIVNEVNSMNVNAQKERVLTLDPHALDPEAKRGPEKKVLPELPGAEKGKVVMRLAPYPSGALHIGNARMLVLNDEYVKRYNGKLLLVYDDTIGSTLAGLDKPNAKFVIPEAYDLIKEGLDWLDIKVHDVHYKSDRVEIYQEEAGKAIDNGQAYVCTCAANDFRENYKVPGKECPCRNKDITYHQEMYDKMKGGQVAESAAVVRLKTGMDHKDPAMRDHIIMRISDAVHPRIGSKVRLWPILEWSWGLDDHLLGVTHIIRGIDLRKEGEVEKYIWDMYGWEHSHISLYGRLKFNENYTLSKTAARKNVHSGNYHGWADPRTWSLQSLEQRGIKQSALREALLDLGLSKRSIAFDEDWIYSKNRPLIDNTSNRYWFAENPRDLKIKGIPFDDFTATPLINPNNEALGSRKIPMNIDQGELDMFISGDDLQEVKNKEGNLIHESIKKNEIVRLKDMFNIKIDSIDDRIQATFYSTEKEDRIRKIQGIPAQDNVHVQVLQPDGNITDGVAEMNLAHSPEGAMVHFIRYGFLNIQKNKDKEIFGYYSHN